LQQQLFPKSKHLQPSSFCILNPNFCAYVDVTGSGNETISHILENGRATVMFCSFEASPRIPRLFCTGKVVEWNDPSFKGWLQKMGKEKIDGARAVILLSVFKVQTSCGYGVPYLALRPDAKDPSKMEPYLHDRDTLGHWAGKQVSAGTLQAYQRDNNNVSLDGLPGLRAARKEKGELLWYGDMKLALKKQHGLLYTISVALISALLTIISLYFAGLMTLERPEAVKSGWPGLDL